MRQAGAGWSSGAEVAGWHNGAEVAGWHNGAGVRQGGVVELK